VLLSHELYRSPAILQVFGDSHRYERFEGWLSSYSELVEHLTSVTPEIDRRIQEALSKHSRKLLTSRSLMRWVDRVLPPAHPQSVTAITGRALP
jgi:hypothetical protein